MIYTLVLMWAGMAAGSRICATAGGTTARQLRYCKITPRVKQEQCLFEKSIIFERLAAKEPIHCFKLNFPCLLHNFWEVAEWTAVV